MPKLLRARLPQDAAEERQVRKLAGSRHAPADWIRRARMIVRSGDGLRTAAIAAELGVHPQTVREKLTRFHAGGLEGLGDRPGGGRKPRLTEAERSAIIGLVATVPPGRLVTQPDGTLAPARPEGGDDSEWSLDALAAAALAAAALAAAAQAQGIQVGRSQVGRSQVGRSQVGRSQVRRILVREGVRWRHTHSWSTPPAQDFAPQGRRSSPAPRTRWRARRRLVSLNSVR